MKIVVTGGAGFLGRLLARALLAKGQLSVAAGAAQELTHLCLTDRVAPQDDPVLGADPRVSSVVGDLNDLIAQGALPLDTADLIFHLAAAVSGECEADFDLGMRSNFEATHALLQAARLAGRKPTLVFASSLAVFGKRPGFPMPELIEDDTLPTPQSSYGIQKLIGEHLVADFTRKGFIRGRSVRLMTVSVRAGRPNGAASGFLSGMIREPLAGQRAACPVPADTIVALSSPARTVEGIVRAAEVSDLQWGPLTGVNLPALRTTVGEMAAALGRVGGQRATDLLDWTPDPAILKLVETWPGNVASARAKGFGLHADASFDDIVREYVRQNPQAIKIPIQA